MIRPVSTLASLSKTLTQAALTMLNSEIPVPHRQTAHAELDGVAVDASRAHVLGKVNGHASEASTAPALDGASTDVAMDDWDDLFRAVKARLRRIVAERPGAKTETDLQDALSQIRTGVLECVGAMEQLQSTLVHEASRRHQLEIDFIDASGGLMQAYPVKAGP